MNSMLSSVYKNDDKCVENEQFFSYRTKNLMELLHDRDYGNFCFAGKSC